MGAVTDHNAGLQNTVVKSLRWTLLNAGGLTFFYFLQIIVLGRLLSPEAFGLMALVLIVAEVSKIFAQLGLSEAIISKQDTNKGQLASLYWVNVLAGFLLYGILFLAAPFMAAFFGQPALTDMLRVFILIFPLAGFGIQFEALLRKNMRFDILTIITLCGAASGAVLAIAMAVMGYGVWSMVFGQLLQQGMKSLLLIGTGMKMHWLPSLTFKVGSIKEHLSFGGFRVGAMTINQLNARIDQLAIGAMLGPVALGFYHVAFNFVIQPVQLINPVLTQVAFPAFSKVQDDTGLLKSGYLKMIEMLSFINAPLLLGLAAIAPTLIPFLMGEKWEPAVPVLQILALYAFIRSIGNAAGSILLAKGKANWTFYWNALLLFIIPAAVIVTVSIYPSLVAVAATLALLHFMLMLCHYAVYMRKIMGNYIVDFFAHLGRGFICALVMAIFVYLLQYGMNAWNPWVSLLISIVTGVALYILLSYLFNRTVFKNFMMFLISKT